MMSDLIEQLRRGIAPPGGFARTDACVLGLAEQMMSQAADEIEGMRAEIKTRAEEWRRLKAERDEAREEVKRLTDFAERQRREINELNELADCKEALRELGRYCGCDHVESADEREVQKRHIVKAFEDLIGERDTLRSENIKLAKLVLTPDQFRALADFILRHGELTNGQGLTALLLRNMADEAEMQL